MQVFEYIERNEVAETHRGHDEQLVRQRGLH
jgi:hypothetical protein